jgi:hypothetical protein
MNYNSIKKKPKFLKLRVLASYCYDLHTFSPCWLGACCKNCSELQFCCLGLTGLLCVQKKKEKLVWPGPSRLFQQSADKNAKNVQAYRKQEAVFLQDVRLGNKMLCSRRMGGKGAGSCVPAGCDNREQEDVFLFCRM